MQKYKGVICRLCEKVKDNRYKCTDAFAEENNYHCPFLLLKQKQSKQNFLMQRLYMRAAVLFSAII